MWKSGLDLVTRVARFSPALFCTHVDSAQASHPHLVIFPHLLTEAMMRTKSILLLSTLLFSTLSLAKTDRKDTLDRLDAAATVMNEIMSAPDKGVPEEILRSAQCVAVVPSLLKGGFVVGAAYGRGVATCRTPNAPAKWSAPAFFSIEGGSFGLQIGGQAVDLVMIVMNERGMRNLLSSKFKLGADASVAAGPVGRHAEGMTDWKMRAQVLTYSRARGVFAGLTFNGAAVRTDSDSVRLFYGRNVPNRTILMGRIETPADGSAFTAAIEKATAKSEADKTAAPTTKK
jgi:lipid-binding SYLF domain-containing protein